MKQGLHRIGTSIGRAFALALVVYACLGLAPQASVFALSRMTPLDGPGGLSPATLPRGPLAGHHASSGKRYTHLRLRSSAKAPDLPALESSPPEATGRVIPNHYIVVLEGSVRHPGAVASEQAEEVDGEVGFVYRSGLKGYSATMSKADAAALREDPAVRYVVPDRQVSVTGQATPAGITRIAAPKNPTLAIDAKENVTVDADIAIIDSGIDSEQPDLNVVSRTDCVPAGEDTTTEYEAKECKDESGYDLYGHGTHVAGTAAALDNGEGVVGVAPGARLWAVRVMNREGFGSESWIVAGVDWVTAHAGQIEVANMSLSCKCSMPAVETAIKASSEAGVVYTLSAGNSAADAKEFSPAKNPNAITVSALALSDKNPGGQEPGQCLVGEEAENKLAWFSNYGSVVDVAAPGVCIYSTLPDGEYWWDQGTSMAAPHVAGAAAIIASRENPGSLKDVEAIRQKIVEKGSSAWEDTSPDGVKEPLLYVEDSSAFKAKAHPVTQPATIVSESEATLRGLANPEGAATSYWFEYGTTAAYGTKIPTTAKSIGSGTEYQSVAETVKGLKGQTLYHYRLVTTSSAGTFYGDDRTLGTTAPTASVETPEAHANDATLKASINPQGSPTVYRFEYGTTTAYGRRGPRVVTPVGAGTSPVQVKASIGMLTPSKTYHYRLFWKSAAGAFYGTDRTFTTQAADWTAQSTPAVVTGSYFWDVSCSSQGDCMAVGETLKTPPNAMLAEHWDGKEWTVKSVPEPVGDSIYSGLSDVSCPSSVFCLAVGSYQQSGKERRTTIERWDGAKWSVMWTPPADPGGAVLNLSRVSCISASACVAVGDIESPPGTLRVATAVWDGSTWTMQAAPEPASTSFSSLLSVSCIAPASCMAVGRATIGGSYEPLALQWNGEAWKITQESKPAGYPADDSAYFPYLTSVSCWKPDGCVATEMHGTLSERWNGETWEFLSGPEPVGADPDHDIGRSVACPSAESCIAVGFYSSPLRSYEIFGDSARAPQALQFDGTQWSLQGIANPAQEEEPNGIEAYLLGIDCPAKGACFAVGSHYSEANGGKPLIERYRAPGPISETLPASAVVSDAATLNAKVNPQSSATTYQLEYGTTSEYGSSVPASPKSAGSGSTTVEVSEGLSALAPDTTYHFRVKAVNANGSTYGEDRSFSTPARPRYASTFGEYGTGKGQLNEPLGIALDPQGNVWVADSENDRIEKFNPAGELLLEFGSSGTSEGHFDQPYGLAIDSEGYVWVADAWNDRIQEFNAKGEFVKAIGWGVDDGTTKAFQTCTSTCFHGISGSGNGQLYHPYGLTFDAKGNLWVADTWNARTQKLNSKGEYLSQFAIRGVDIAADAEGNLWLVQDNQDKVLKLSPSGVELDSIGGTKGSKAGEFNIPTGIGLDNEGNIWVADSENDRIQGFSPAGDYFAQLGEAGTGKGQLDFPRDVAFDLAGNVWVADSYNSRVQRWRIGPEVTSEAATGIENTKAILHASVNPEGSATSYWFEYGPSTAYGSRSPIWPKSIGSGTTPLAVAQTIGGLEAGATYHFRVVAKSPTRTVRGADLTFIALNPPKATTEPASEITSTKATLNGTVNPEGSPTSYWFEYGTTASYGTKVPLAAKEAGSGTANVAASQAVSGLEPNTPYHFRLVAEGIKGTTNGADRIFTTTALKWTQQSSANPSTSVRLNDVSCASTSECIAVGLNGSSFLAERWNGSEWATMKISGSGELTDVSCASASFCLAVPGDLGVQRWNGSEWSTVTAATPAGATSSLLYGVSCTSSSACIAVGTYTVSGGASRTLAESWDGSKWTILTTTYEEGGANELFSVSCTASSSCTAIGKKGGKATALRWNGSEWSALAAPANPPNASSDVSCSAANACTMVFGTFVGKAERWNGSTWSTEALPSPESEKQARVYGVSCTSATSCFGVGTYNNKENKSFALAEGWNGSEWSLQSIPSPEGIALKLSGLSCASASKCTAVGYYEPKAGETKTLAERYGAPPVAISKAASEITSTKATLNGTVNPEANATSYWFEYGATVSYGVKAPLTAKEAGSGSSDVPVSQALTGLEASATYHFRLVAESAAGISFGKDETLATSAPKWTQQSSANPSTSVRLNDVSCASASECVGVGSSSTSVLAERWNGSEWATMKISGSGELTDVSCTSASFCLAVPTSAAAQRWNGSEWVAATGATPAGGSNPAFYSVSCTSSSACIAVGTYTVSGGASRTLAESWDGSKWTVLTTPFEEGGANELYGVSCTASSSCTAIGKKGGKATALRWNGSEWSSLGTPESSSAGNGDISCATASSCTVAFGGLIAAAKVEQWNGTKWSNVTVPTPEGGSSFRLYGVSCASATSCIAVGNYTKESKTLTVAEGWNGSEWSLQSPPNPEGGTGNKLAGASCVSASKCTAAGFYTLAGETKTLAARYE